MSANLITRSAPVVRRRVGRAGKIKEMGEDDNCSHLRFSSASAKANFTSSVHNHKQEYWRNKCHVALQAKRNEHSTEVFELLQQFNRLNRWEGKSFAKVDWKDFYSTVVPEEPKNVSLPTWTKHPVTIFLLFLFVFACFFTIISIV
eukprot:TRINITY_DN5951_c0_g1_i1.p1 TRINITY_DN5951_c0_g1~~TRINITY_DN5951_c0_g1_i1.p1  ORF type:complete len:146 (-),score=16.36 TRINITY_DN5951_c0_g1_i1:63-500(-)